MQIINLVIRGKQAIGDGTKIVCMNKDYVVRISLKDCAIFETANTKKLVVKCGHEYKEAPITIVRENGTTYGQADLPIIRRQKQIELGIYGADEDGNPIYTSNSAKYDCIPSVLCGALILNSEPVYSKLEAKQNNTTYTPPEGVTAFSSVDVEVPGPTTETQSVTLNLASGNQTVSPSASGVYMSAVTITKPGTLLPENIRKDTNIAGVVGTLDKVLRETTIYSDGEYTPPSGVDGFSKVTVNVGSTNWTRTLTLGASFTYEYNPDSGDGTNSAIVTIDGRTSDDKPVVKYENDGQNIIVTALAKGNCSVVIQTLNAQGVVAGVTHYAVTVTVDSDRLLPVEASTVSEMRQYLTEGVVGTVIKYKGASSEGFVQNALYIIEEE